MTASHDRTGVTERRRPARQGGRVLLAAMLGLAAGGSSLRAQSITIVDPPQWREEKVMVMETRTVLRIAGFVSHPNGIARVRVNGLEATFRPDPDFPDSGTFEKMLPADSLASTITISVEPRNGTPSTYTYSITLPPTPTAQPPLPAATVQPNDPNQIPRAGDAWGGFKFRGILYAAAVAGGGVLTQLEKSSTAEVCLPVGSGQDCFDRTTTEPSYQSVGLAAAGAGVALFVIDAVLTSKKAKSATGPTGDDSGLQIQAPAFTPSFDGVRLNLIRLRFH